MSIEKLQEKIRKMKSPTVLDMNSCMHNVPAEILAREPDPVKAGVIYSSEIMWRLKGKIPALRFSYSFFSLIDRKGIDYLTTLMRDGKKMGYYILLDGIDTSSVLCAQAAGKLMRELPCDSVILSAYAGTDVLEPFISQIKDTGKSVFVLSRSANPSASQVQDLMTGSRLVYVALGEMANRLGNGTAGKSGYQLVGCVAAANRPDCLKTLRSRFKDLFLLVDGYDYSNANAKYCSYAFDNLGHGAAVCGGEVITAPKRAYDEDYLDAAEKAAERMLKNLTKYVTVL